MMGYELIITEKPKAAQKIADALADGRAIHKNLKKIPFYELTHKKQKIVVACAVGHLFQIAEKSEKKFQYPIFDIEWKPTYLVSKGAAYTRPYVEALKELSKNAESFTIATDYDIEGEVIGLNVLNYCAKQKDGARMKFSTLTKPDLVEAYEHKSKSINWGQANAGVVRHQLDWIYGINLSRALTASLKKAGLFKIMSSGRVQGPALKIIVDREKEIKAFRSEPFWQIELQGDVKKGPVVAWHEKDKFWKEPEAKAVIEKTKGKKAVVRDIEKSEVLQNPPFPFDLTSLQIEAFKCFRINPKELLDIAQNLYISGLISYPRTSSQELPPAIGYKKILEELSKQESYSKLCRELIGTSLKPNNGKKTDPAHPAIYPTGIEPSELHEREHKVYDLIVKRFMAVFGEPAVRNSVKVSIDVNSEIFIAKGITTVKSGWHRFYAPYGVLKEEELPAMERQEEVKVKEIVLYQKETQPPKRYTQASIVNELAKRNLGTKATRANIIDTLFQRSYIKEGNSNIEATGLGISTIDTLEKYSPTIVDEELTRKIEEEMDQISLDKKDKEEVFQDAKKILTKVLEEFKSNESKIGKDLAFAKIESDDIAGLIGKCPKCGSDLQLRRGKYGQFVACKNYPECKTTFKLPGNALIKASENKCESCGYPMIKLIRKAKKPQEICLNHECPSKKVKEELDTGINEKIDKKCPKCGGELLLRKSVYGRFIGCSGYPKCRYTEKLSVSAQPASPAQTAQADPATQVVSVAAAPSPAITSAAPNPASAAIKSAQPAGAKPAEKIIRLEDIPPAVKAVAKKARKASSKKTSKVSAAKR
jgi:DNA topoisomerase-1